MNTDDLIAMLAAGPRPASRAAVGRRLGAALGAGALAALAVLLLMPLWPGGIGGLSARVAAPLFWAKLALTSSVLFAALCVASRLSQPGVRVGRAWIGLIVPIAVTTIAALTTLFTTPADARIDLVFGHTWRTCSLSIAFLSMPALALLLDAMRRLAPTRPERAGAAAGLLAGAIGASAYCLRCPEMDVPFWATWYLVGMAVPAVIGSLIGRRAMRW